MKINFVPRRALTALTPASSASQASPAPSTAGEFMRPNAPFPRPAVVDQRTWETLAIHLDDAQRGGPIATRALRAAVAAIVRELRVGCMAWEEIYPVLDAAVWQGGVHPQMHPLQVEFHANRSAAIVAHMHSWADMQRLAELEDPCADE